MVGAVTCSPTWYMRGGPQPAASGVVTQQSATVWSGQEAKRTDKALLDPRSRDVGRMPSAILVDGHSPTKFGGTGRNPPRGVLRGVQWDVPLILAGVLTPDNIGEAIRAVQPYAVDVASGVEREPGIKDVEKMRQFIEAVRNLDVG